MTFPKKLKLGKCKDIANLPEKLNKHLKDAEGIVIIIFSDKRMAVYGHGKVLPQKVIEIGADMLHEATGLRVVKLTLEPEYGG